MRSLSKLEYSEKEMADAFQELLESSEGLPGIGTFDRVHREIDCRQGRPDFIALRSKNGHTVEPFPKSTGLVGASVLSLLKPRSPRTLDYLVEKCEFSRDSVKRSLRRLSATGHIDRTESGLYVLGAASGQFCLEIWAMELKLNNPRRAIFQAQQSRAFAERSIIIVPPSQTRNYQRFSEAMTRWEIGLATFDPLTRKFSMKRRSRKSRALSREHQIYAIAQLYSEENVKIRSEGTWETFYIPPVKQEINAGK